MPIYMKIEGLKGDVEERGAASGVWKTTNFLTADRVVRSGGGPHVKVLSGSDGANLSGGNLVPISRISLTQGGGGVEGRDASAKVKVEQLIHAARSQGPSGKLYLATDTGVYATSNNRGKLLVGVDSTRPSRSDAQGRLLVGSDQGVWRAGGANKFNGASNLKQIGLAVHNSTLVEIIVTDAGGMLVSSHRLPNVSVTGSSGTFTLTFNGQTTGG